MVNPYVHDYKNPKSQENTSKNAKQQHIIENQKNTETEI